MPAKPMSDSHDKSDDLIAELAKLMASGASGGESAPKPTVIKLPPLDEATIKSTPVRIPGMDAPSSDAAPKAEKPASTGAAVRIPGMDRPAGVDDTPTAPAPRPASQFGLGSSSSAPAPAAPPSKSTEAAGQQTAPQAPRPAAPQSSGLRIEPVRLGPTPVMPRPAAESAPQAPRPEQQPPRAEAGPSHDEPEAEEDDPIADLIARELEGESDAEPPEADAEELPRPPVAPAPVHPKAQPAPPSVVQARPASVSVRQPDSDQFSVMPNTEAPARQSPLPAPPPHVALDDDDGDGESDPMDEIESLIGEAVRVELNPPEKPAQQHQQTPAAPVVPPLNTSFTPRRTALREQEPEVESAEAAIMAAAESDRYDDDVEPQAEERPYKRMRVKPPRTSGAPSGARQFVGIAVAGTLLLAAGFGLYWVLGMNRGDPTEAPVLTADATPAKVEPVTPPTTSEPASGSVVFDEIDGVADEGAEGETLVSRDETAGETPAEVARVVTPSIDDSDGTTVSESGLANRKVRTVTVRPDGTIVASEDTVAGTSELPVDRPNVPEIEGTVGPSDLLTAAVAETRTPEEGGTADDPLSALVAETPDAAAEPELPDPIDVAALNAATDDTPAVFDGSLTAPRPMPRPFNRQAMVGGGATSLVPTSTTSSSPSTTGANTPASTPLTALTQPTTSAPAPASTASSGSRTYVQLSSQRTEADANASLRSVQSRLGSLLSAPLEVRRVDLGAKGIWYRVVMPTGSFQDATQSCARIKANGGDCVAING